MTVCARKATPMSAPRPRRSSGRSHAHSTTRGRVANLAIGRLGVGTCATSATTAKENTIHRARSFISVWRSKYQFQPSLWECNSGFGVTPPAHTAPILIIADSDRPCPHRTSPSTLSGSPSLHIKRTMCLYPGAKGDKRGDRTSRSNCPPSPTFPLVTKTAAKRSISTESQHHKSLCERPLTTMMLQIGRRSLPSMSFAPQGAAKVAGA